MVVVEKNPFQPWLGSMSSMLEKTTRARGVVKNKCIDWPAKAKVTTALSHQVPCRRAAKRPAAMPRDTDTIEAARYSCADTQMRSFNSSVTLRPRYW